MVKHADFIFIDQHLDTMISISFVKDIDWLFTHATCPLRRIVHHLGNLLDGVLSDILSITILTM